MACCETDVSCGAYGTNTCCECSDFSQGDIAFILCWGRTHFPRLHQSRVSTNAHMNKHAHTKVWIFWRLDFKPLYQWPACISLIKKKKKYIVKAIVKHSFMK